MNVYDKAQERFRLLFELYGNLHIAFSGGKDSLALLYTAIPVARELGKRLRVVFIDEELVSPATLKMVELASQVDCIDLHHVAVSMADLNGCCKRFPFWFPWHEGEENLWAREKPDHAITTFEGHVFEYDKKYQHPDGLAYKAGAVSNSMTMQSVADSYKEHLHKIDPVYHVTCIGLRVRESFARRQTMNTRNHMSENWCANDRAYPIWDWEAKDTFRLFKWLRDSKADYYFGYNQEYDFMHKLRKNLSLENAMRVGPPLASEALRQISIYAQYYPEIWTKMVKRAEGVQAAYRNSNSMIYGVGQKSKTLPKGITSWKQYTHFAIKQLEGDLKAKTTKNINACISIHKGKTNEAIPEESPHPLTGLDWRALASMAVRGAFRDRLKQSMSSRAEPVRKKLGLTLEELVVKHGTKEYQKKYFGSTTFQRRVGRAKQAASK